MIFLVSKVLATDAVAAIAAVFQEDGVLAIHALIGEKAVIAFLTIRAFVEQFSAHAHQAVHGIFPHGPRAVVHVFADETGKSEVAILVIHSKRGVVAILRTAILVHASPGYAEHEGFELFEEGFGEIKVYAIGQCIPLIA